MSHDSPEAQAHIRSYWRKNLILLACLLSVWFIVSFGCGVLFVDVLDQFRIPGTGFKLGFWFAQQGSIYTFIVLIAIYVLVMNRLDHSVDKEVEQEIAEADTSAAEI
jgi:putative solute:sodium symporter small subunit